MLYLTQSWSNFWYTYLSTNLSTPILVTYLNWNNLQARRHFVQVGLLIYHLGYQGFTTCLPFVILSLNLSLNCHNRHCCVNRSVKKGNSYEPITDDLAPWNQAERMIRKRPIIHNVTVIKVNHFNFESKKKRYSNMMNQTKWSNWMNQSQSSLNKMISLE